MKPNARQTIRTYIAIDSCVVNIFSKIDKLVTKFELDNIDNSEAVFDSNDLPDDIFEPCARKSRNINDIKRFYYELYLSVKNDDIRLFVCPMVMYEVADNENKITRKEHLAFIEKFCYAPSVEPGEELTNTLYNLEAVKELATMYVTDKTYEEDGEVKISRAPMDAVVSGYHDGEVVPSNDALIMAYATVYNCLLLTENAMHFIYLSELDKKGVRADKINKINLKNNYISYVDTNGFEVAPSVTCASRIMRDINEEKAKYRNKEFNIKRAILKRLTTVAFDGLFTKVSDSRDIIYRVQNDQNDYVEDDIGTTTD